MIKKKQFYEFKLCFKFNHLNHIQIERRLFQQPFTNSMETIEVT